MNHEIDLLVDYRWWAGAIVQRHGFDLVAHEEGRHEQKVDPDAHPERAPGPDFVLTDWAKDWIRERVIDQLRNRLLARNEKHGPTMAETREQHLGRELERRAHDYFGASHDATRKKFRKLRDEHHKHRGEAKLAELREQHEQTIAQIDSHLDLVDRHIATVTAEVDEERRVAQRALDELAMLQSHDFEALVAHYQERVLEEIRRDPAACLAIAAPSAK